MKGMKKSMFISTVLMVVILIVALSTATFAWFAANDTAIVTDATMSAASAADANIAISWISNGEGTSISFQDETGLRPTIPKTIPVGNTAGVLQATQYISTTDFAAGAAVAVVNGVTYNGTPATYFDIVQAYPATQEFVIAGSNDSNAPSATNDFQLTGLSHRDMIYKVSDAGFRAAATQTAFNALTEGRNWIPFTTNGDYDVAVADVNSILVIADGAGAVEGVSVEVSDATGYVAAPAPTAGQVIYYASEVYAKVAQTTATVSGGTTTNTPTSSSAITMDGGTTNYQFVVAVSALTTPGTLLTSEVDIDDVQAPVAANTYGLTHALIGERLYCAQAEKLAADNKTLTTAPVFMANFNAYSVLGGTYPRFNGTDASAAPKQMAMAGWTGSPEQIATYGASQPNTFYVINKNGSPTAAPITINVTASFTGLNASLLRVAIFTTTTEGGTPEYKGTLSSAATPTTYGIIATGVDSTTMPKYTSTGLTMELGQLSSLQAMELACIVWYDGTLLTTTSAGLDAVFSLSFTVS